MFTSVWHDHTRNNVFPWNGKSQSFFLFRFFSSSWEQDLLVSCHRLTLVWVVKMNQMTAQKLVWPNSPIVFITTVTAPVLPTDARAFLIFNWGACLFVFSSPSSVGNKLVGSLFLNFRNAFFFPSLLWAGTAKSPRTASLARAETTWISGHLMSRGVNFLFSGRCPGRKCCIVLNVIVR